MALTKILITVKTYPAISSKYEELVCTAGFREDGSWVRIYPVPFRKKPYAGQYKKYDWIEVDLIKNRNDFRPESFRPYSYDSELKIIGHLGTRGNWYERKKIALRKVYHSLSDLIIEAKNKEICTSLAVFKPKEILDFNADPVKREWDKKKLAKLQQLNLFESSIGKGKFEVVKKLPYKFSYLLLDEGGKRRKMMIEDWEMGQLYWNCLARHEGNESKAITDVKNKYFNDFAKSKDLYLFLGTSKVYHYVSPNPFMVIGVFYPKREIQGSLF